MKNPSPKERIIRELMSIPGVGNSIANDLYNIGIRSVRELKDGNPEKLYDRLCSDQEARLDRCLLYVMRCAVYFASSNHPDPEKLLWWKWKD